MQTNFITDYMIPASLMITMFGVGIALRIKDFIPLAENPRAVALGTFGHFIVLPALGMLCIALFDLRDEMAIGTMLVVSCGAGVMSNVITLVAKADTALSVTLTSISLPASAITIPLIMYFSMGLMFGATVEIVVPFWETFLRLVTTLWIPIALGMMLSRYGQKIAISLQGPISMFSLLFMAFLVISMVVVEREHLRWALLSLGPALYALNTFAILIGVCSSRLFRLGEKRTLTIAIELGIQNSATAMFIALSILDNSLIAVPAAVYTLIAFINVALLILVFRYKPTTALQSDI